MPGPILDAGQGCDNSEGRTGFAPPALTFRALNIRLPDYVLWSRSLISLAGSPEGFGPAWSQMPVRMRLPVEIDQLLVPGSLSTWPWAAPVQIVVLACMALTPRPGTVVPPQITPGTIFIVSGNTVASLYL